MSDSRVDTIRDPSGLAWYEVVVWPTIGLGEPNTAAYESRAAFAVYETEDDGRRSDPEAAAHGTVSEDGCVAWDLGSAEGTRGPIHVCSVNQFNLFQAAVSRAVELASEVATADMA